MPIFFFCVLSDLVKGRLSTCLSSSSAFSLILQESIWTHVYLLLLRSLWSYEGQFKHMPIFFFCVLSDLRKSHLSTCLSSSSAFSLILWRAIWAHAYILLLRSLWSYKGQFEHMSIFFCASSDPMKGNLSTCLSSSSAFSLILQRAIGAHVYLLLLRSLWSYKGQFEHMSISFFCVLSDLVKGRLSTCLSSSHTFSLIL